MQSLCSSESMRRNFTTLVAANVNEAKKGSKKRRPTSTPTETYVKVNQQAAENKCSLRGFKASRVPRKKAE